MMKLPKLAGVFTSAKDLLTKARAKGRSLGLCEVLQPFQSTSKCAAGSDEEALSAFLSREDVANFPVEEDAVESLECAFFAVAGNVAFAAGTELSKDEEARLKAQMPLLTRLHAALGELGVVRQRGWMLAVLEPVVTLHEALLAENEAEASGEEQSLEICFPRAIHIQSLIGRCQERCDEDIPDDDEQSNGETILKPCKAIITNAQETVDEMGAKLQRQCLSRIQTLSAKSVQMFGKVTDVAKRGSGQWAEKMKPTCTALADNIKYAEANLLTEANAKRTNEFAKSAEQVCSQQRRTFCKKDTGNEENIAGVGSLHLFSVGNTTQPGVLPLSGLVGVI